MNTNPIEALYRLWAKTNERDNGYTLDKWQRHPLPLHLLDVGYVAETWLKADPLLLRRFCALVPNVEGEDVRRLLILVTALHDLGKIHPHFQAKSEVGWREGYAALFNRQRPDKTDYTGFDHGAATAVILSRFIKQRTIPSSYKPLRRLIFAAAGHHGTLYEKEIVDNTKDFPHLRSQDGQLAVSLVEEVEHHFGAMPALPVRPGNDFCMLAAGFVSVCDWIGSDSWFFSFAPKVASREDAARYLEDLRKREPARHALRRAGLLADFLDDLPDFASFFEFETLLPLQQVASTVPFGEAAGAEIAIIEEPMGGGKTEIAQYLAARALARRTAAGLYFALPTQASANALFKRTLGFTRSVAAGADVALVLAHGGRRFFEAFRDLLEQSKHIPFARSVAADTDDPAPPSEVIATAWLMPTRKALLAPVGLGTIDQAMLGALSVRHAFVRLFGLARKVVVLDEIHAYDAYMGHVIVHLLRWLRVLGAKVILLSATLPDGLRRDLLAAYDVVEPSHEAHYAPYPQIVYAQAGTEATVYTLPVAPEPTKTVSVERLAAADVTAAGVDRVLKLAAKGGCIAWIRNTVREAQEAYRQIKNATNAEVVLLHARFTRADRNRIEEKLVAQLGKAPDAEYPRPQRLIVIATQVIEQSVDLDFDVMVSDLAPIDLLLQRSGRLHRHPRPAAVRQGHTTPRLVVLMPAAGDRHALRYGLSAYVYDPETLARTAALLPEEEAIAWTMPAACRMLVSDLYDQNEAFWTHDRLHCDAERLEAVRERACRLIKKMEQAARSGLMPRPDVAGLLAMQNPRRDASDDGARVLLTTRYGGHSATVTLFHRVDGRLQPIGQNAQFPDDDADFAARLAVDEAFMLSSVSFPWYEALPDPEPEAGLTPWVIWWQQHHRFDARLFAIINETQHFDLSEANLHGRYTCHEGLVIDRADRDLPADPSGYADAPPYETL